MYRETQRVNGSATGQNNWMEEEEKQEEEEKVHTK